MTNLALVSMIGRGIRPRGDQPGAGQYLRATYDFAGYNPPGGRLETSLFGTALLRYLRHTAGLSVRRWIVLGTRTSCWSEMIHAATDERQDEIADDYLRIAEAQERAGGVTDEELTRWRDCLATVIDRAVELHLVIVPDAFNKEGQFTMLDALFGCLQSGESVAFDITHGYRHLPVIAGYALMLMRQTHAVPSVSFHYGAFEARTPDGVTPVVRLDLCEDLMRATESMAIFRASGNYVPLAGELGELDQDARRLWFLEATHQVTHVRRPMQQFVKTLETDPARDPLWRALAAVLREELGRGGQHLGDRLLRRAKASLVGHTRLRVRGDPAARSDSPSRGPGLENLTSRR